MKILVNNIHSINSTSLIMLLKRIRNIHLEVYGADVEPLGYTAASNFVDRYFQAPPIEETERFTSFLYNICTTEHIDLIIPSSDKEVRYWSQYTPKIPVKVYTPNQEIVSLFQDKLLATLAVRNIGLDTPKIISNLFLNGLNKTIFRKRKSVSSRGIEIVNFSTDKFIPNRFNKEWFAQEYIDGIEYTVDVFCDKIGAPKIIIPRKKLEMREGATIRSQLINHQGIIAACKTLYQNFCVPGLSDVEFIESNNHLYFIEMNLRFSASTICGIVGSFNFIEQYLEHFYYNKPLESMPYYMKFVCWNSIVTRYYEDSIQSSSDGRS